MCKVMLNREKKSSTNLPFFSSFFFTYLSFIMWLSELNGSKSVYTDNCAVNLWHEYMCLHKNMFPGRPRPYDPLVTTYQQLPLDGNTKLHEGCVKARLRNVLGSLQVFEEICPNLYYFFTYTLASSSYHILL